VSQGGTLRCEPAEETIDRIFELVGLRLVLGIGVIRRQLRLNSPRNPISRTRVQWGGWGGSLVVNDVDTGFTSYVMNRMGEGTVGDDRAHTLLRAMYASLG
jgi:hypothetical protein